jgi:hypothetical protein
MNRTAEYVKSGDFHKIGEPKTSVT